MWIGVKELDEAMKTYERMGFERGRMLKLAAVNARARELPAGRGTILLVQPANIDSPAAAWLGDRPHRLMGLSIKVKNVAISGELLATKHRLSTRPYQGLYGKSILASPTAAGGVWIEFFERGFGDVVRLEPDVANAFPDAESVNEALRFLIRITKDNRSKLGTSQNDA